MSNPPDDRLSAAYAAIREVRRPEIWIDLLSQPDALVEYRHRLEAGGALAQSLVAVKGNIDVAGFATTAGCPAYPNGPAPQDAAAVARLRGAGGTIIGTTNLDQFATGLVGQRSPYGGVRDSRRHEYISGGSSSGSAVAVALGLVDIAVGTDTAGSGRIPAALQGIWGIKPTLGVVSTQGVIPACRSWDTVTIFARDPATAEVAMGTMAGGPSTRMWPSDTPLAAPAQPRVAVPDDLSGLAPGWKAAFDTAVQRLRRAGCTVETTGFDAFLSAARLLYDGALVAERHAAVGDFVTAHPDQVDPTVRQIISRAGELSASEMVRDHARLNALRSEAMDLISTFDALLVPTAPGHPSRAEVASEPIEVNSWMGTWTNFCNLFDFCAVAAPAGVVDEGASGVAQFGVTVLARAFHDAVAMDLARKVSVPAESIALPGAAEPMPDPEVSWTVAAGAKAVPVFVVGAHLRGQPLEYEMTSRGAKWIGPERTSPNYRLFALDTNPPKPGLVRADDQRGVEVVGELWLMSPARLGDFLACLPQPMTLGSVELSDGRRVTGFGCDLSAIRRAADITAYGGWRGYLKQMDTSPKAE